MVTGPLWGQGTGEAPVPSRDTCDRWLAFLLAGHVPRLFRSVNGKPGRIGRPARCRTGDGYRRQACRR